MYDIVVRSRKCTLREELAKGPLDPYPVKLFRALPRRASLPFARQDAFIRQQESPTLSLKISKLQET
jgi:hypothetical protein